MTEPIRKKDHLDRALNEMKMFIYDLMLDSPQWTGHFTVHVRDGVILDKEVTRRYKAKG
mgnify:CR=1 FL=1